MYKPTGENRYEAWKKYFKNDELYDIQKKPKTICVISDLIDNATDLDDNEILHTDSSYYFCEAKWDYDYQDEWGTYGGQWCADYDKFQFESYNLDEAIAFYKKITNNKRKNNESIFSTFNR